jgi:hypothetical protein
MALPDGFRAGASVRKVRVRLVRRLREHDRLGAAVAVSAVLYVVAQAFIVRELGAVGDEVATGCLVGVTWLCLGRGRRALGRG